MSPLFGSGALTIGCCQQTNRGTEISEGIRKKASIPLSGEHGRISHTWWRECGGPLSRLACVMPSLGVLPVFYRQGSARILLEFCSNLARILLEFRSSQTQKMLRLNEELCAKFRRRKKKKHWRAKTGQSATNFSHCRKGILSVTLPRSFVTIVFFCSNFARILLEFSPRLLDF